MVAADYWRRRWVEALQAIPDPAERARTADAELKRIEAELRVLRNVAVVELAEREGPRRVGGQRRARNWTAASELLGWTTEWTRKLGRLGLAALRDGQAAGEPADAG